MYCDLNWSFEKTVTTTFYSNRHSAACGAGRAVEVEPAQHPYLPLRAVVAVAIHDDGVVNHQLRLRTRLAPERLGGAGVYNRWLQKSQSRLNLCGFDLPIECLVGAKGIETKSEEIKGIIAIDPVAAI